MKFNTLRRATSRLIRPLAVGVLAAGLTVGAAAAPASASPPFLTAKISITERGVLCCNDYRVTVTGHALMSRSDAQRFLSTPGAEASMSLWGQDGWANPDDRLTGSYAVMSYFAAADGLYFSRSIVVDGSVLDEDWGSDQVYAKVRLLDIRNGATRGANTNVWHRSF